MDWIELNMILDKFFGDIGKNLSWDDIKALKMHINRLIVEEESSINMI